MITIPHLAESDYREPVLRFSVPRELHAFSVAGTSNSESIVYGVFWPSEIFWTEVLLLVCVTVVFAAVTAAITYHYIVGPKQSDTTRAFLLGYGMLLPFWLAWPFLVNPLLDCRNLTFKFIVGGVVPTVVEFRLLEAIHGCCPEHATKSLNDFVIYFASVLVFERDAKTNTMVLATNAMKVKHFLNFVRLLFVLGAFQSILTPYQDFNVFGMPIDRDEWFSGKRWMTWELYANSFLHAILFQLHLTTYCEGLTFFWFVATGYQTKRVMNNPLGGATSPSDFWGRRWNMLVQNVLKGGVYKPLRKYGYSPTIAAVSTFLMSGLFHEWLTVGFFVTACATDPQGSNCYHPFYGGAMVFFGWQALLIALEYMLGRNPVVAWVSHHLPTPVRSFLIIMFGIPMAHFFLEPYVRSNFFRHGQMALPLILPLN